MEPDQATFLLRFLLPQLKSEKAITKKILLSVPPEQESYKPAAKCMSALELSRHLTFVEIWFLDAIIHRHFGMVHVLRVQKPASCRADCSRSFWVPLSNAFGRSLSTSSVPITSPSIPSPNTGTMISDRVLSSAVR